MRTPGGLATLLERIDVAPTLARFRFALEGGVPDFLPGQFLTLGLPVAPPSASSASPPAPNPAPPPTPWRAYSLASSPHEKRWVELYVREALEPVPGRFTPALFDLRPGEALPHRGITGAFTIESLRRDGSPDMRSLLCVASGTGIAPFVAYAEWLHHAAVARRMVIAHGARVPRELGYLERLREIEASPGPFRLILVPTVSRPNDAESSGWTGESGRVETLLHAPPGGGPCRLERLLAERGIPEPLEPARWFAHACGFEGTVTAVVAELAARGFRSIRQRHEDGSYDLKTESFG